MSLRRPTVALLLFTFDISPLCDVAQTSDCGILAIYFWYKPFSTCRLDVRLCHALSFIFQYEPFMWCRSDARLWHVKFTFTFRGVASDTRSVFNYFIGISGGLPPDFLSFIVQCKFITWACITNLLMCIMFAFVISYVQTVLYIQSTHLACWFGQMLTKAILWMNITIASPTPIGVPVSPVRSRSWSLVLYMLPLP